MDLGDMGWGDMDWIYLAKDRGRWWALVNTVIKTFGFLSSCTTSGFSRRVQLHDYTVRTGDVLRNLTDIVAPLRATGFNKFI
jgi:hypothetical protein